MDKNKDMIFRILKHRNYIFHAMNQVIQNLQDRAAEHDISKFSEEEFATYAEIIPALSNETYGTPEYQKVRESMGSAVEHHNLTNRHHWLNVPEKMNEINIFDLIEMMCDWYAVNFNKRTTIETFLNTQTHITDPTLIRLFKNSVAFFDGKLVYDDPQHKYILSFDVESDGLLGDPFYFAIVIIDLHTNEVIDSIRCHYDKEYEDEWVKENVSIHAESLRVESKSAMYQKFWEFFSKYKEQSIILSDVGRPVEMNFIKEVIRELDMEKQYEKHPYIILDLASYLAGKNYNPDLNRFSFVGFDESQRHDPYYDALSSGLIYNRVRKGF